MGAIHSYEIETKHRHAKYHGIQGWLVEPCVVAVWSLKTTNRSLDPQFWFHFL